jgi:tetratricopeptide (TPR) repeat protein
VHCSILVEQELNRSEKRKHEKLLKIAARKAGAPFDRHGAAMENAARLFRERRFDDAEKVCTEILAEQSDHPEANHLAGLINLQRGDVSVSAQMLKAAVDATPENGSAQANYGVALSTLGKIEEAAAAFEAAIRLNPNSIDPYNNLAALEMRRGDSARALELYHAALAINPRKAELHANLANALLAIGEVQQSIIHYRQALAVSPNFAEAHYGLGQALRDMGDIADAIDQYESAMRFHPDHANAMLSFAMISDSATSSQQSRIRKAYDRSRDGSENRMLLSFARGKLEDSNGDYESACRYYLEGNAIRRNQLDYSAEKAKAELQRITSVFDEDFLAERKDFGVSDDRPIFILGMPRSGTSLVEQILASHSRVTGAGEIPHFPQSVFKVMSRIGDLDGSGRIARMDKSDVAEIAENYASNMRQQTSQGNFFTDKLPANFMFIGMIRLVFPKARIVHCTRDPRDTCISMFKTFFPSGGHHFSYDWKEMADYYRAYSVLMDHWKSLFGNTIIEANYETLVRNPNREIPALLDNVGLEFDPNCLEFHKIRRVVRTASAGQVRKPIYTSSIGNWRRCEPFLPGIRDIAA